MQRRHLRFCPFSCTIASAQCIKHGIFFPMSVSVFFSSFTFEIYRLYRPLSCLLGIFLRNPAPPHQRTISDETTCGIKIVRQAS